MCEEREMDGSITVNISFIVASHSHSAIDNKTITALRRGRSFSTQTLDEPVLLMDAIDTKVCPDTE